MELTPQEELKHIQDRLYRDWMLTPHQRDSLKHQVKLLKLKRREDNLWKSRN